MKCFNCKVIPELKGKLDGFGYGNQFHDDFMFIVEKYYQSFPLGEEELPVPKVRSAEWLKESEVRVRLDMCAFEHRFTLRMYEMVEKDIDDLCAAIDRELEE